MPKSRKGRLSPLPTFVDSTSHRYNPGALHADLAYFQAVNFRRIILPPRLLSILWRQPALSD